MIILPATQTETDLYHRAALQAAICTYANRIGVVAVKRNKIFAGVCSRLQNDANNVSQLEAAEHAEMGILQILPPDASLVLYIARLDIDLVSMPSRPCIRCMRAIKKTKIASIIYKDPYGHIVREVMNDNV